MSEDKIEAASALPPELQMEMAKLSNGSTSSPLISGERATRAESIDSPDQIIKDLLSAEKQIAEETIRLMKTRFEREKDQWKSLHADKERELLSVKSKLSQQEGFVKSLK